MKTSFKVILLAIQLLIFQSIYSQNYKFGNVYLGGGGFVSAIITCPTEKNLIYARTDVGGAYRWDNSNLSWIPILDWTADDQAGFQGVEALAVDPSAPSKVYMLIGIDYFNSGKTAIARSSDYGATFSYTEVTSQFKAHGNGMGRQNGERLAVDPNKGSILFCGTRRNGLFKSVDNGTTWSNVASFPVTTTSNDNGICFVLFDKSSGTTGNATQTIYVGVSRMGSNNIYVSKDGGASWNAISGQSTTYMPQRAVLASDKNLYITYGNGAGPHGHWSLPEPMDNGQIWKLNTQTNAWTDITPVLSGTTTAFGGISVDASNPQRIIATTINKYMQQPWGWGDRIFLSTNGGTSWTDLIGTNGITMNNNGISWIDNHAIHWAGSVEIDPYNPDRVFLTSGNGIFMCENLSATNTTWKFMTKGLEETVPLDAVSIPGGPLVWVIGDYDGCTQTDITQSVPVHSPSLGTTTGVAFAAQNSSYVVRVGGWENITYAPVYYSNNSGSSWTQFATQPNGGSYYKGNVAVSANGGSVIWCPDGQSTAFRTTNNGASWTTVSGYSISSGRICADQVNSNKFYTYDKNSGNVYVSTNAGSSFSQTTNVGSWGSIIIRTVPGVEGDVWIPLYNGGLTRSTNSATSFTKVSSVSKCTAVGFGKAATGKTYPTVYIWGTIGSITGVFRSEDAGSTWIRVNDDAHQWGGPANGQFVIGDMNKFGRFFMSTGGRGIVYGEPEVTSTITISLQADNTNICTGTGITLTATASVSSGSISKVEFFEGATLLGSKTISPYTLSLDNLLTGTHNITAKATSNTSETATSQAVTITVSAGTTIVPYIQINNGTWTQSSTASLCEGGSVTIGSQPAVNTGWTWSGPNGYTANLREIVFSGMTAIQSGTYTASYDDGSGCASYQDFVLNVESVVEPDIVTPITYSVNDIAIALSANGTDLKWYDVANGGTALTSAPTPGTSTVDTLHFYVTQTINGCESDRSQIDVFIIDNKVTQTISLEKGWNLISTNVSPADSSITTLFNGLNALTIKTMSTFWYSNQPAFLNTLQTITAGEGYLVYMNATGTLTVTGVPISILNFQFSISNAWHLIGCPYQTPTPFSTDFNAANCQTIKNFDGFWEPNGTLNSIQNLEPGKGYFIK